MSNSVSYNRNMNINLEQLESRVALDADAVEVYGPAIPPDFIYTPPPVLLRVPVTEIESITNLINNTPVESLENPIVEDDLIPDRTHIWDDNLHVLFSSYASDGEITLREARDIVVNSDDGLVDGSYVSRFEQLQTINYIYGAEYNSLYNRQSQVFMMLVIQDNTSLADPEAIIGTEAGAMQEGLEGTQILADYWYSIANYGEA